MGVILIISLIAYSSLHGMVAFRGVLAYMQDRKRRVYRLNFPADLTDEHVIAWVHSIAGTLHGGGIIAPHPSLVFEMMVKNTGITHRLRVPWEHADYVVSQLRRQGVHVTPEEDFERRVWVKAVEVGMRNSNRMLRLRSVADTAGRLLHAVQAEENDAVLMQWVVTPAAPAHKPIYNVAKTTETGVKPFASPMASRDEVNERRDKLTEPNVLAVLRVAATSNTSRKAEHLIVNVRKALVADTTASTKFTKRFVGLKTLQRRIDQGASSLFWPMQLTATELAGMIAWPVGNPLVPGLPPVRARQFPPNETMPTQGIVVGTSAFPGSERPVALGYAEALMHTHVLGSTGVGKSNLLAHVARQIMGAGYGLILMETEGNLYKSVLDYVPVERMNDVVLLDVADQHCPVGFNVLDQGDPVTVIDEIMDLFTHRFGKEGMGVWSQEYIYHGLRTIAEHPELSFIDLVPLLNPHTPQEADWVDDIARQVDDDELKRWWQRHDNRNKREQQQRADPVLSRIWQLASRPELRFVMGQRKSTFKIADIMKDNKILLINLKGVSRDTASLAGTLIMNAVWHAVKTVTKQVPTYLILDEFADFMDLPIDTESMLAQARKHNFGMFLANQHMAQLKPSVREAVISNARTKLVFQTNRDDAKVVGRELGAGVEIEDITHLQKHEAIARLLTPTGTSSPVNVRTQPPAAPNGKAAEIVRLSRETYGRPLDEVKQEIENRYRPREGYGRRPVIGHEGGWA